ncbi:aliphatic sulfonate ABC transporter substrate-binding protein [Jiangella ureilytica]|uniref:Aliphatic sulfonate ABC transporter substrate-binding protein n=1 Tax=Jiangella ureilytica TaxID=2530374 RepID=A0A4R4RLU6_9ACTN|nr:aliphatic sulfonate ABC transporter substrate-binding protein [Jiangella ureilytica]TDC50366.1 aliphatic sulfonate ABC transporter substrate-binding protein [Jiangella ureilytica]
MIMRRSVLAVPLMAALAVAGCSGDDSDDSGDQATTGGRETVELNVGYIDTSINGVGLISVANDLDLWEKAGIDVNLTPFTNGPTQVEAMAAGSLDVGYMGAGATWMPASGQAVIVAPSEATYGDFLIASPDSGAQRVEDIEGLRVGVPVGGSGEMILSLALDAAGLTEDDIEKVPLDPPAVVSAFVSGQIDVAAIFSPLSDQIMQSVPEAVVIANNKDFPDVTFLGAWVASNEAMEDKQEAVERFLEVYIEANDYRKENPEDTVELAAAESGAPAEQLQGQVDALEWFTSDQLLADNEDGATRERFGALQDLFVELGRMESARPVEEWVNIDLFAQAAENLS